MAHATPWNAQFITTPQPAGGPHDPAPHIRRQFGLAAPPERASLHLTAVGLVEARLNGSRVGDEVLTPGWTSYRHHLNVTTVDVTGLLRPGPNVVAAILGQGWAVGREITRTCDVESAVSAASWLPEKISESAACSDLGGRPGAEESACPAALRSGSAEKAAGRTTRAPSGFGLTFSGCP